MSSVPVQGTKVPHAELSRPGKKKELYFSVFPREQTVALGMCCVHLLYPVSGMQCVVNVGRKAGGREGEREGGSEGGIYERLHDPHFLDHLFLEEFTGEMEITSPFTQWLWSNPLGSALAPSLLHAAQQTHQQKKTSGLSIPNHLNPALMSPVSNPPSFLA